MATYTRTPSIPPVYPRPDQDQKQDQDQDQWQKQLELQLQAQLQAQLALQGQAQFQESKNENENDNKNDNENENENKNESYNENENENKNENYNANKNENENENKNVNINENKVDVDIEIDLDLEGELLPTVFDLHDSKFAENNDGIVFLNNDNVHQDASGGDGGGYAGGGAGGNTFNVDQINNMVDNDTVWNASVNFGGSDFPIRVPVGADLGAESFLPIGGLDVGGVFVQHASIDGSGGNSATGATNTESGAGSLSETNSADVSISQSAFNQEIVMGANLQNNSISAVVGGGSQIGDDLDPS